MRTLVLLLAAAALTAAAPKPHIVFVLGDHEYSGEATMPLAAAELERDYGMRCAVLTSAPRQPKS
jgi:hypothetical protein